ncbi:hypothetical protein FKW77_008954 [Venturia effusa]|uniref:U1 small nuclear ribonucleoprotein C n=1 Tax=Venturia effusa TaxID=50376 RepID=A0A517LBI0_9PEZI|nr:hypothetical protein FKW77_008954 [Venturia effusa]
MSVRKAHNSGRNHLRNVIDYYQQIGHEKAQSVIDSITSSYADAGQAASNPMLQQPMGPMPGGFGGPPPPFGFPDCPGAMPPPPFGINGGPPPRPANLPAHLPWPPPNMPFPPPMGMGFPPPGQAGSPPQGMPFPPPGGPGGMPFPPQFPPNNGTPVGHGGYGPPGGR